MDFNLMFQITSLKSQMEGDASTIERINAEKSELLGGIGELKARITSLEGQVSFIHITMFV